MEYVDKHYFKQPQRTSILSGCAYIEEILHGNDSTCFEMFRVHIPVFRHLCYTLRLHRLIVEDERDVSLEESIAMFLFIVGHNTRQKVVGIVGNDPSSISYSITLHTCIRGNTDQVRRKL
jgi:hypothetical protein